MIVVVDFLLIKHFADGEKFKNASRNLLTFNVFGAHLRDKKQPE